MIFFRSCFRGVSLIFIPLTKISPDIPLLILNKADTRLLFPAPVLPTLRALVYPYYHIIMKNDLSLYIKYYISLPIPTFSPGFTVKFIDFKTLGPSVK